MELTDHSLRQMDEDAIHKLPESAVRNLAVRLLKDLKEARERLNQNSRNSSRPPGSDASWEKVGEDSESDGDDAEDAEWEAGRGGSKAGDAMAADGAEPSEAGSSSDATADESNPPPMKRKPGKQPGAPGFGRQQRLPVTAYEDHRPTGCHGCGKVHEAEASASRAYSGFYTLDIEWGDAESPGLRVTNTLHRYYETPCDCGHLTREEPRSQPAEALLPDVALSEWRRAGAFDVVCGCSLSAVPFTGTGCRIFTGQAVYSAQCGHRTQYPHGKRSCDPGAGRAAGDRDPRRRWRRRRLAY